jgi:hypothetical protein
MEQIRPIKRFAAFPLILHKKSVIKHSSAGFSPHHESLL